jgi:uncharacterized protein (DUF58 family)
MTMDRSELLRKIKSLEIRTKGLTRHLFSGEYHSAFKGRGMTFNEVREYQPGDDVRMIDWNVTARTRTPHLKVFEEERELTILLLIDASGSMEFGSDQKTKKDLALEVAATLSFSATANNDKVGALFFTDKVEKYIAPAKGQKHILHILTTALQFKSENQVTRIEKAIQFLERTQKKRTVCFLISDFSDANEYINSLQRARKKHDLIGIQVSDDEEYALPKKGFIHLYNAETGSTSWLNAADKRVSKKLTQLEALRDVDLKKNLSLAGIDLVTFKTNQDIYFPLMRFFKTRS